MQDASSILLLEMSSREQQGPLAEQPARISEFGVSSAHSRSKMLLLQWFSKQGQGFDWEPSPMGHDGQQQRVYVGSGEWPAPVALACQGSCFKTGDPGRASPSKEGACDLICHRLTLVPRRLWHQPLAFSCMSESISSSHVGNASED